MWKVQLCKLFSRALRYRTLESRLYFSRSKCYCSSFISCVCLSKVSEIIIYHNFITKIGGHGFPPGLLQKAILLHAYYMGCIDTGHFFNTSLIQSLVFKGIVKGQESKVWAFFKGLRSFRGPQKQN